MNIFGLILVFCGSVNSAAFQIGTQQKKKEATFDRFDGSCPGHNVPLIFNYYGIRTENTKLYMNSSITAKEDIAREPMMSIRIQRCKNRENLDTCEEFHNYKTGKYCTLIGSELWGPLYSTYTPPWKCPIKKGVYYGTECMLEMSAFLLFPVEEWFWKVKGELRDKATNRLLFCIHVEAHIATKLVDRPDPDGKNGSIMLLGRSIG